MSRFVGIVALVIAFGWGGFVLWRVWMPGAQNGLPDRPKPIASIQTVQRDLCSLAKAELDHRHLTGHYATLSELRSVGKAGLPDSRWPYVYVLNFPTAGRFVITAVSLTPIEGQPRVLQVDEQMQVQSRSRPSRVYPCEAQNVSETH
jgi:hypothetical protein